MKVDEAINLLQALRKAIHGHSKERRIKYAQLFDRLYNYNEQGM